MTRLGHKFHVGWAILIVGTAVVLWAGRDPARAVVAAAYAVPNGGGYCSLADTGVSRTIKHDNSTILAASNGGSYCCGFTFDVAMAEADRRGLIKNKSVAQVRTFQKEWYGASKDSELRQCAAAVEHLGVGREIKVADAEPGDFMAFRRTTGSGHSVVFLGWMKDETGSIVGLKFRSSQPETNGVGDVEEYFSDGPMHGLIERNMVYVARLNRGWGW